MKLSFSTVGCPDWTFDEIFAAAKDFGYGAVEIRGMGNEIHATKLSIFSDENINATMQKLRGANLEISLFASNAVIGSPDTVEQGRAEAREYIDLAAKTGVKFVRVLVSPRPEPEHADIDAAAAAYSEVCGYAKERGVTPLIETNGIFAESEVLAKFMENIPHENKGVLWDINHPCRYFGETAKHTFDNIGRYVKYLHIKDSVSNPETKKIEYRMPGHGDLPVYDILKLMSEINYDGYLSLEWTKRWDPELQEPGIVFSYYVNYMRYLLSELQK